MEFKQLGKTGVRIPVVGMGTWKFGVDKERDIAALREGIRLGMKFIDTAEMYHSEHIVGDAIDGERYVFVATKVTPHHLHYDDVIRACENSLRELRVKQIDLYQIHWPNKQIPIKETMQAMEQLVKDGKIKYIGVSNFDVAEFEEAQAALKSNEIVSNQVEYSLLVRDPENNGVLDYCKENKVTLIAYSPLVRGALFGNKYKQLNWTLNEIGRKHNRTVSQVALAWLLSKEPVVVIPKASSIEHVRENAAAAGLELSKEELAKIDDALHGQKHSSVAGAFSGILKGSSLPWKLHEKLSKK